MPPPATRPTAFAPPPEQVDTKGGPKGAQGGPKGGPKGAQLWLRLDDDEALGERLRTSLAGLGLRGREVNILVLVATRGESRVLAGQQLSVLTISEREAAKGIAVSRATFREAVADLVSRGVLDVVNTTRPRSYIVNRSRVALLEPAPDDPLAQLAASGEVWAPLGPPPRDSVKEHLLKIRGPCSVTRDTCATGPSGGPTGETQREAWRDMPWSRTDGVTDEQLVRAVVHGELEPLRLLWQHAVGLGWIRDTSADGHHRFLVICHHAATTAGIARRMGMVVSRVRRELDVAKTRQASDEWAAEVLRRARRDPELSRAAWE